MPDIPAPPHPHAAVGARPGRLHQALAMLLSSCLMALALDVRAEAGATLDEPPAAPDAMASWWQDVLATRDHNDLTEAKSVLARLRATPQTELARCQHEWPSLEAVRRRLPISLALQQQSLRCLQAQGRESEARARATSLARVKQYLQSDGRGHEPLRALELLLVEDADVMIERNAHTRIGDHYQWRDREQRLVRVLTVLDQEQQREHTWYFDVTTLADGLDRDAVHAGYPGHRVQTVRNLITERLLADDPAAQVSEAMALGMNFLEKAEPVPATLLPLAQAGNADAATALAEICLARPQLRCQEQAASALAPFVERGQADALIALAAMKAAGAGVRKNRKQAEQLLNCAHQRVTTADLMFRYARLRSYGVFWQIDARGELQPVRRSIISQRSFREVVAAWKAAIRRGHAEAQLAFAKLIARAIDLGGIREARFLLADLAHRGYPEGLAALAEFDLEQGLSPTAVRADLKRAHELGSGAAALRLYRLMDSGALSPEPGESAWDYLQTAARRGEPDAIAMVLKQDGSRGALARRPYWLHAWAMLENRQGLLDLLDLLRRENTLPAFLADDAAWLAEQPKYRDDDDLQKRLPWLRWRWSSKPETRQAAFQQLEARARTDAPELWLELGRSLRHGTPRLPADTRAARSLFEHAAELPSADALRELADLLCQRPASDASAPVFDPVAGLNWLKRVPASARDAQVRALERDCQAALEQGRSRPDGPKH